MNKAELIQAYLEKREGRGEPISKAEATRDINDLVAVVEDAIVNGDGVQIVGSLTLKAAERAERTVTNPQTKKPMVVPAHKTVKVTVGAALSDKLNGKGGKKDKKKG